MVFELFLSDHGQISENKLIEFAEISAQKGAKKLLCTEKDMVKLMGYPKLCLPLEAVKADLEIVEGKEQWIEMIQRIQHETMG